MNYLFPICFLFIFSSCTKGQDIQLEIVSNEINSLVVAPEDYGDIMGSEDSLRSKKFSQAKTVVEYKLTNNSSKTYFFNIEAIQNNLIDKNCINFDKSYLIIFDKNEKEVKVKKSFGSQGETSTDELKFELLNYDFKYYHKNRNFIIHPNETLYFEWFIVLPFGTIIEQPVSFVNLDPNKKYEVELQMTSYNSNEAQKYLSRTELETIKTNGYEIFNGTITSKNRIPIKFIE